MQANSKSLLLSCKNARAREAFVERIFKSFYEAIIERLY